MSLQKTGQKSLTLVKVPSSSNHLLLNTVNYSKKHLGISSRSKRTLYGHPYSGYKAIIK